VIQTLTLTLTSTLPCVALPEGLQADRFCQGLSIAPTTIQQLNYQLPVWLPKHPTHSQLRPEPVRVLLGVAAVVPSLVVGQVAGQVVDQAVHLVAHRMAPQVAVVEGYRNSKQPQVAPTRVASRVPQVPQAVVVVVEALLPQLLPTGSPGMCRAAELPHCCRRTHP